jgi:Rrf2 family protein
MHLLAQEEYGFRCLIQVAQHEGGEPLTIPVIAGQEGLSPEYTAKLMRALRRAGLVTSTRGASGGYQLARPATEINAWQVIEALGGSFFPDEFCDTHPGQLRNCVHNTSCAIRGLWSVVEGSVRGVLQKVTLADLKRDERAMVVWLEGPDAQGPSASLSS